jgi:hypothetical protein
MPTRERPPAGGADHDRIDPRHPMAVGPLVHVDGVQTRRRQHLDQ